MRNLERSEMAEQSIAPKSRIGRFLMVCFIAATSVNRGVRPFRIDGCCGTTVDAGLNSQGRQQNTELAHAGSTPADIPFTWQYATHQIPRYE